VENICNVNDAETAVIVAVGMYKPWSQCFKRTIWHVSYVDIIMKNTNIAIGERYSKFFTELFILKLFRRPFPV
jgi:hypothetical protein